MYEIMLSVSPAYFFVCHLPSRQDIYSTFQTIIHNEKIYFIYVNTVISIILQSTHLSLQVCVHRSILRYGQVADVALSDQKETCPKHCSQILDLITMLHTYIFSNLD